MNERFTIGKLAQAAGVRIDTVRFYERKGIISRGTRRLSSFKEYSEEDARKIRFIKRAQEVGFTLAEIKELLALRVSTSATCRQVKAKCDAKLSEIDKKISDLKRIRTVLQRLSVQCENAEAPTSRCPILGSFEERQGKGDDVDG